MNPNSTFHPAPAFAAPPRGSFTRVILSVPLLGWTLTATVERLVSPAPAAPLAPLATASLPASVAARVQ